MKFTIIILILLVIWEIGFSIWFFRMKYKFYSKLTFKKEESIIKILQEIACDYHVRVFKSSWGNLTITPIDDDDLSKNDIKCFDMNSDNTEIVANGLDIKFEYADSGDFYFINFRVLGKCYLAYGDDIIYAWINVIKKARDLNKKFFYRNLDRQKL